MLLLSWQNGLWYWFCSCFYSHKASAASLIIIALMLMRHYVDHGLAPLLLIYHSCQQWQRCRVHHLQTYLNTDFLFDSIMWVSPAEQAKHSSPEARFVHRSLGNEAAASPIDQDSVTPRILPTHSKLQLVYFLFGGTVSGHPLLANSRHALHYDQPCIPAISLQTSIARPSSNKH